MKLIFTTLYFALHVFTCLADTPPPGTVKAKMYSGDGNTAVTTTGGGSLNVNVTNSSGLTTVNQGNAGAQSWLASITSSALPTNACTETTLSSLNGKVTAVNTGAVVISSSALPSGASTAAKQPALGTAGTASADVISVQGIASMTALKVDGSAVTQPVSAASLPLPAGASTSALQITGNTALTTINTTLGSPFQAGGSIGNSSFGATQATASSLNATVVTTGGTTIAKDSSLTTINTTLGTPMQNSGGSVTANIGTTNGLALDATVSALQVSQGSTTSGQKGDLTLGAVTTSAPTYTTAQSSPLSMNTNGGLRVDVSGSTVPLPTGASTSALQTTGNTSLSTIATNTSTINTTLGSPFQAGGSIGNTTFTATQGTAANFNATVVTTGGATIAKDSSLTTINTTLGTPMQNSGGSVTANAGTNLNTSLLALDTSVNGVLLAQNSTTSGQTGPIVQGAVTTSAPTYTTAKTSPLSLTTAGALRVDSSAVTQPVSIATAPVLVAGSAIIGKVGIDQTTPGTTNGVQVNAALPAGSNVIGHVIVDTAPTTAVTQSGTFTVQPGNTANTTAWLVNSVPKNPTAGTVTQAAVTIGTSATRLTVSGSAPSATRILLVAQLLSSSTANCFFGSSSVANSGASRGVQMFAGQSFTFNNDAGDYYGICDASSQTFLVVEQ